MENLVRVLVVDDEANQRTALARLIAAWRYEVQTASDGGEALVVLKDFDADIVITDLNMPGMDGKGLLDELRKLPSPPVPVVVTAFGNLETALETVHHLGAFWYIEKPIQAAALKMILERAAEKKSLIHHAGLLERELASRGAVGGLLGESTAMQEIFSLVQQVAPTSATILITGESGTGKEVLARAVHQLSPRRSGPFFAVNCAAMPEALMESELFGHEKGAFTGAVERRAGCFELAKGGTILLDEIGDMPMATQAKLLRVLEDRKVRRLGSAHETELDVRVLASTNRDLTVSIAKQTFREDLYFRLNVFEINLPALRRRKADIPLLAAELLRTLNQKHDSRITDLSPEVLTILTAYDWPGNVRELRNVLERAAILCGSGTIVRSHLPPSFGGGMTASASFSGGVTVSPHPTVGTPPPAVGGAAPAAATASAAASAAVANGVSDSTLMPGLTIADAERTLIELTLRHTGNNRTRAAELLGISAKTLFNKLREYGRAE